MEDTQIIALYFARSEAAIAETAQKYGSYLRALAGNMLRSREDAEEVVGDTYWRAWNSIPPTKPASMKHFLSRITRNLCLDRLDYLSAQKRGAETAELFSELDECVPDHRGSAEENWEAKRIGELLNQFLAQLPKTDRVIFLSRYYYAMPIRKIVDTCQLPERKVKYRLSSTRKALRIFLEKEGVAI